MKTFGKEPGRKLFCRTDALPESGRQNFILKKGCDPDCYRHYQALIVTNLRQISQNDRLFISIIHPKTFNSNLDNLTSVSYPLYELKIIMNHALGKYRKEAIGKN
jgi:hypothetical protein